MPYQPETSYFVRLDAPPPLSRQAPRERARHWEGSASAPPPRRRRRRMRIRPVGVLAVLVLGWLGWAFTTPGGPSARIHDWISRTQGDVADVSASPGLAPTAGYLDQLYRAQGGYPDMSESQIEEDPNAGMGLGMTFIWCSSRAVVLQSLSAGGSVSRLLLDGRDLGSVNAAAGCPANLAHPSPWKVPSHAKKSSG